MNSATWFTRRRVVPILSSNPLSGCSLDTSMLTLRRMIAAVALLTATCAWTTRAGAQSLRITSTSAMDFQTLSPLATRTITPASAQAAVFTIQGLPSTSINVLVVTPDRLIGSTQFVSTASWTATVTTQFGTSPSAIPLIAGAELAVTLGTDGLAVIRVGATIAPPMTVGSGTFSSVITLVARDGANGLMSLTSQASATAIIRQPLLLTAVPMAFGSVFVNTPKTLAPTNVNAFKMLVDGALGASIDVTLESVPTSLIRSGGSDALSIGTWRVQSGGASCTGAPVAPSVSVPISLDLNSPVGGNGRTSYCLGATVTPTALQAAGNYIGTVVVSVRYTGA
jgi:hypothetical protein